MITDLLIVTLSTTTFVDARGRINLFHGELSLDESHKRGLTPLIVFWMSRRTTSLCLFQFQLPNTARLDAFLASAWAIGCLGGAPNLLMIPVGLNESHGKQILCTVRALCPRTKVDVLTRSLPTEFEQSAASHMFHLEDGCVDDSLSCEEIVEVGNRRERLETEMERQRASVPFGARIKATEMKHLFVDANPCFGAALTAVKSLPDGCRWVEHPKATNLVIYGQAIKLTDEQMIVLNEKLAMYQKEQARYDGSLSKLREALRCLPYGRTEAFEESLPEYGVVEFLEGDDNISRDLAQSIHERMQENNVYFPVTSKQFLAALQIATDDGKNMVAIAQVTSRTVGSDRYRFLISAQSNGTTILYCVPSASTIALDAWLRQIGCYVGPCEILSEAMLALKALVNLPMTAALNRKIPALIDCFLEEDPEWPNYPKSRVSHRL